MRAAKRYRRACGKLPTRLRPKSMIWEPKSLERLQETGRNAMDAARGEGEGAVRISSNSQ